MGQEHTITLGLDEKSGKITIDENALKEKFMNEYEKTFGSKLDTIIEIVSIRASIRVPLPRKSEGGSVLEEDIFSSTNKISCFSFSENKNLDFEIISRSKINEKKTGPMIIVESTAITYVDANYHVNIDGENNLLLTNGDIN